MSRRVVITGMGAVTPVGNNVAQYWDNLKKGVTGIGEITRFDTSEFKVKLAAEVKNFDITNYIDKKEARRMDPFCHYAIAAAREAVEQSGLVITDENADQIGCIIGSGVGGIHTIEVEHTKMLEKGPKRVSPLMVPMLICNMAAGNVAIDLNIKGKCTCIVTACASATHSIGEAYRTIQHGEAVAMVAGGSEASITPFGIAGFASLNALNETSDISRASIPFDAERHGFIMGEGSGIVVLEELEHAKSRGASILAEIVGYGASCDAYHITSPAEDGSGAAKAMQAAINEAGINPEDVEYINAHGTGTKLNDLFETRAIKLVWKEKADQVVINSTKSMIGHLLGAAGGVELIACVKSIEDSYIHETVNLKIADPECDLDYAAGSGRDKKIRYAMSNSLGFGGHNGSLLIKEWEE